MGGMDWLLGKSQPAPKTVHDDLLSTPTFGTQVNYMNQNLPGLQNRQAPTIDPAFRNAQIAQMSQLQGVANGNVQGAGELAVQRQMQNAMAAQQAQAMMARGGGNAALAMRNSARNQAGIGLSAAGQGQQAAMGDQMAAQGLLGQIGAQGRAGDLGVGQMQQQQTGMNDQAIAGMLGQYSGLTQAQLNNQTQRYGINQSSPGMLGPLISAGGQIGAAAAMPVASDERLKTEISDGDGDIDAMLDGLVAKRYRYKDEKHGKGSRVGIMAQDLERSKAGRDIVRELPEGKHLDVNAALSAALASVARLNARVRKVEGAK